jgi:hypothetical protein
MRPLIITMIIRCGVVVRGVFPVIMCALVVMRVVTSVFFMRLSFLMS